MIEWAGILIPLLVAIVTAAWGYKKFLDERDLNSYRENVKNLFSSDKQVLLSAIATLGFYKQNKRYSSDVTDILVNRIYTELDYDVTNAIIAELSQVSTEDEIIDISCRLLDINRNFVVQKTPAKKRKEVIENIYRKLEAENYEPLSGSDELDEAFLQQRNEYLSEKRNELYRYNDLIDYQLAWHQQMVSDALAMSLLQANRRGFTKELKLEFYGNSILHSQFYDITLRVLDINFTDFSSTSLLEIESSELSVSSTYFEDSLVRKCDFRAGKVSNAEFINSKLDAVDFGSVKFEDVYFIGTELNNCNFANTEGLNPLFFYNCKIAPSCKFNEAFDDALLETVTKEQLLKELQNSTRSLFGKSLIADAVEKQNISNEI